MLDTDIGQAAITHMDQRLRHAVDEGFGPDEAVIGQQIGAIGHVLSAAETDLEMQRAVAPEQPLGRNRTFGRHGDLGEQIIDQILLALAQRLALAAAVEPAQRGRIAFLVCRHGAAR